LVLKLQWEREKFKLEEPMAFDVPLAPRTTFRVGGPADALARPRSVEELIRLIRFARAGGIPITILGGGANIVVSDAGVRGLVILTTGLDGIRREENHLYAGAGMPISDVSAFAARQDLAGLAFIYAMPGTTGGAIWMNARCYDGEIAPILREVRYLDLEDSGETGASGAPGAGGGARVGAIGERKGGGAGVEAIGGREDAGGGARVGAIGERKGGDARVEAVGEREGGGAGVEAIGGRKGVRPPEDHEIGVYRVVPEDFSYKISPFQDGRRVILEGVFELTPAAGRDLWSEMLDHEDDRRRKGHFDAPCAGSIFKNDRTFGEPSGRIIDRLGLRGTQIGGARVSDIHGNIIVNTGTATARDIRTLTDLVRDRVAAETGYSLEPEVLFIGEW
jgi:UDP-N-acetylenolpyruvoylglucosamine reductase